MTEPRAGMETKNTAPTTTGAPPPASRAAGVREVAAVFLKLGLIGFGGPAAHIALMEEEVVRRRRWVTREKFLDLLGATNLIPGPNSTEMAIHLGHGLAGFAPWWLLQVQGKPSLADTAAATAAGGVTAAAGATSLGLWPVFWFFLKVGSVLYGSGYVLLAFLRADLVERWGWLSEAQLLDAIAVGQVTPGPVFTTATFIGYLLQGTPGALVATAGIFLPSFFFVAVSGPIIPRVRASPSAGAFLDGVNVASLALMTVVTWRLGQGALTDALGVGLAVVSAVLLLCFRMNSAWLILGGAAVGWLTGWWH
jgi:chromate transport protein ChrA